jgi:peptidoglycan/xylan/chitin deacetylase (PgdA/CDA1 family)
MFTLNNQNWTKTTEGSLRRVVAAIDDHAAPSHNPVWQSLALRPGAIQPKWSANAIRSAGEENKRIHEAARQGTSGPGAPLPFLGRLQNLFGRHDVSRIVAHTDDAAATGSRAMGAKAFTIGNHVAFAGKPDLHTAAHEAAHAVQQRGGLLLSEGVGRADDRYERHADAVAELVARGDSAESLLDQYAGRSDTSPESARGREEGNHFRGPIQLLELTYDDGPDENTRLTLEELKKGGAKAIFYLVGQKVQSGDNWKIVFAIGAAGNWLGNHAFDWNNATDNHIFLSGTRAERASKLLQTEFAIRNALVKGKADAQANKQWDSIPAANRDYINDVIATGTGRFRTPGFRSHWYSPGGSTQQEATELASQIMESAGLRRFAVSDSVSIDPKDWEKGKTKEDIVKSVTGELSSDSDNILLHSRLSTTAAATPEILKDIKSKGFTYQAPARGATTGVTGTGFSGVGTSVEWIESFAAISRIGPATSVNKTDPIDRTVTTQTGVLWIDYGGAQYLAVVSIENSSLGGGTKIMFISFVHQDLKDSAIKRATPNQPKGIQTLAKQYILFAPATPPSTAAKK